MQTSKANVFTRPDTLFGVCEALGEDFRFNPNYLRVALALPLVWQPFLMVGLYAALGLLVLVTRVVIPNPSASKTSASVASAAPAEDALKAETRDREDLLLAA